MMAQAPDSFYEQNYVWQVYFETGTTYAEVILTHNRLLPDDNFIKFDEDESSILATAIGEDDRFMLEAFLTLLPDVQLLSCAMRDTRRTWLVWEQDYYKHIFAEYDKQMVAAAFDGRLWNPDSSADFVFAGGEERAHAAEVVERWTAIMTKNILPQPRAVWGQTLEQVFRIYKCVIFTQTTDIHLLMPPNIDMMTEIRDDLEAVANSYGLVLPPETKQ